MEDVQETMAYYMLSSKLGIRPWEADKMDCVLVDSLLVAISEMGKAELDVGRKH